MKDSSITRRLFQNQLNHREIFQEIWVKKLDEWAEKGVLTLAFRYAMILGVCINTQLFWGKFVDKTLLDDGTVSMKKRICYWRWVVIYFYWLAYEISVRRWWWQNWSMQQKLESSINQISLNVFKQKLKLGTDLWDKKKLKKEMRKLLWTVLRLERKERKWKDEIGNESSSDLWI